MPARILVDSSFLYALYSPDDTNHTEAIAFGKTNTSVMLIPDVTLVEATFLFNRKRGLNAVIKFLTVFASSELQLIPIEHHDLKRIGEIMATYPNAKLDFVDCCVMALSERLNITQVCTFDRRDFSIFRPKHCDYLELLP